MWICHYECNYAYIPRHYVPCQIQYIENDILVLQDYPKALRYDHLEIVQSMNDGSHKDHDLLWP